MLALLELVLKNWRLFAYAAAVVAVLGWLAYEHHEIFTSGEQAAIRRVEQANENARSKADQAAKTVDACFASDGDWDRAHGLCIASPSRQTLRRDR